MNKTYKIIIVGETGLPSIILSDDMNAADENARALNKAVSDHFGCDYLVSPFVMSGRAAELKTYCNNIHITLELVAETPAPKQFTSCFSEHYYGGEIDIELPYVFDLTYDIKSVLHLRAIIDGHVNHEERLELIQMANQHGILAGQPSYKGEIVSFSLVGFNTEHYQDIDDAASAKAIYTLHTFVDGLEPQTLTELTDAAEIVSSTTIATNHDGTLMELYIMSSTSSKVLCTNINEVIPVLTGGSTFNPFTQ